MVLSIRGMEYKCLVQLLWAEVEPGRAAIVDERPECHYCTGAR